MKLVSTMISDFLQVWPVTCEPGSHRSRANSVTATGPRFMKAIPPGKACSAAQYNISTVLYRAVRAPTQMQYSLARYKYSAVQYMKRAVQ